VLRGWLVSLFDFGGYFVVMKFGSGFGVEMIGTMCIEVEIEY
jgi:hypothetical protein